MRRVRGHAPRKFLRLDSVQGASEAPFCACIQYIDTCKLPSPFSGKSTTYGALASSGLRSSHVR